MSKGLPLHYFTMHLRGQKVKVGCLMDRGPKVFPGSVVIGEPDSTLLPWELNECEMANLEHAAVLTFEVQT